MKRRWAVLADEDGYVDREELQQAFLECEAIIHRMGGAFSIVAARDEGEDEFIPAGVIFQWDSFAPARRRPREVPREDVIEEEPEEVAA